MVYQDNSKCFCFYSLRVLAIIILASGVAQVNADTDESDKNGLLAIHIVFTDPNGNPLVLSEVEGWYEEKEDRKVFSKVPDSNGWVFIALNSGPFATGKFNKSNIVGENPSFKLTKLVFLNGNIPFNNEQGKINSIMLSSEGFPVDVVELIVQLDNTGSFKPTIFYKQGSKTAARYYIQQNPHADLAKKLRNALLPSNNHELYDKENEEWLIESSENGNVNSQYQLGMIYKNRNGGQVDDKKAMKWLREAAENGHVDAQCHLGILLKNGRGVDGKRELEALEWFRKAAANDSDLGQSLMGDMYRFGQGVDKSWKEAGKWYAMAAENGQAYSQYLLGEMYRWGNGVEQDYEKAVYWLNKSAVQGDDDAQTLLGNLYGWGLGVEQSYEQAIKWYTNAADQGNAKAQNWLGDMYSNGLGIEQDYKKSGFWYMKSAEKENADAQCSLGWQYLVGKGVEKKPALALSLFLKAAEQGNVQAQLNAGVMLHYGQGIEKNLTQALKWYKKAAENNNAQAQYNLGIMYQHGQGADKDIHIAKDWYSKSAQQGYALALHSLGTLYCSGNGIKRDLDEALKLFLEAYKDDVFAGDYKTTVEQLAGAYNSIAWYIVLFPNASKEVYTHALEKAQQACKLDTKKPHYLSTLGSALYRNGRYSDAIKASISADKKNTENNHLYNPAYDKIVISMCYYELGKKEKAEELFNEVVDIKATVDDEELKLLINEAESIIRA